MKTVDFYFGLGSRYSYLASTRIEALAARGGAAVRWLPIYSQDLMDTRGANPFRSDPASGQHVSGQYAAAYRTTDAGRWAAFYGIPYREPDWTAVDWRRLALALVAAERMGACRPLAEALFALTFGAGRPPMNDAALAGAAETAGLDGRALVAATSAPETAQRHRAIIADAIEAGVFGVPTFILDGALYWGNDRLPLLARALGVE